MKSKRLYGQKISAFESESCNIGGKKTNERGKVKLKLGTIRRKNI